MADKHEKNDKAEQRHDERAKSRAAEGERVVEMTASAARDTMRRGAEAASEVQRDLASSAARQAEQVSGSLSDAAEIYGETVQETSHKVEAIVAAAQAFAKAVPEAQRTVAEWMAQNLQSQARLSQELLRSRNAHDFAEAQSRFVREHVDRLIATSADALRIASRTVEEALQPIEPLVEHGAGGERTASHARRRERHAEAAHAGAKPQA